ncbi:MAG TPA: hypothetical protein VHV79_10770 [Mycobacteriales bacterium]|jgi:hypothetical protein|nr:hypothetical protein [Mycobacteriales bacterium]
MAVDVPDVPPISGRRQMQLLVAQRGKAFGTSVDGVIVKDKDGVSDVV